VRPTNLCLFDLLTRFVAFLSKPKMEPDLFVKNLLLIAVFLILTPLALGTSLFTLIAISTNEEVVSRTEVLSYKGTNLITAPMPGVNVYASLPSEPYAISGNVYGKDARIEIIRQYLEYYRSPLEPYSTQLVAMADKYGLDFKLTTAIAQQESNLCKKIPENTYNCWGWGIHSQGTLGFEDYSHAIETVSRGLRKEYLDKGFVSIEDIMGKYTPLSNGSWAQGVSTFMADME